MATSRQLIFFSFFSPGAALSFFRCFFLSAVVVVHECTAAPLTPVTTVQCVQSNVQRQRQQFFFKLIVSWRLISSFYLLLSTTTITTVIARRLNQATTKWEREREKKYAPKRRETK